MAAEVLVKQGRTRRCELSSQGPVSVLTVESGWAVRAGGGSGSVFCTGTGDPPQDLTPPEPGGVPLRLPEPQSGVEWELGPEVDAALLVEGEASGLVEGIDRELTREFTRARLLRVVLDDGMSDTLLTSSTGITAAYRSRLATLHLEAAVGADPASRTVLQLTEREARAFQPRTIARRLADLLAVKQGGESPQRERGEMVLGPAVGARLLAALGPLWLGSEAAERAAVLSDRQDRLGSASLTVIDNGRHPGGALAAPVDGEGFPTRRLVVVEGGRYLQPIVDWRDAESPGRRAVGCVRRPGWRDRPRPGFSHLFVAPDPQVAASDLVGAVARGFYLLDLVGGPQVDFAGDRFAVPVCGFVVDQGKARTSVARAWLCGGIGALLRGVRAVARDLAFTPAGGGMVGSPSLLVSGLELRRDL